MSGVVQQIGPQSAIRIPGAGVAVPLSITFDANSAAAVVNAANMPNSYKIDSIASIQVSNQNCPVPIEFTFPDTGLTVEVPPFSSGPIQALTNGAIVTVSSPAQALLGSQKTTVNFTLLDFPMQPNLQPAARAQKDAGFNSAFSFAAGPAPTATIPGPGLLFSAAYVDNTQSAQSLVLSGTNAADGSAWSIGIPSFTGGEFGIPLTQAGSTATLTGSTGAGAVSINWRTVPQGSGITQNVPQNVLGFTGGNGTAGDFSGPFPLVPAVAGKAFIVQSVVIIINGVTGTGGGTTFGINDASGGWNPTLALVETSTTQQSGTIAQQFIGPLVQRARDAEVQATIGYPQGVTGGFFYTTVYGSYVDGSQTG